MRAVQLTNEWTFSERGRAVGNTMVAINALAEGWDLLCSATHPARDSSRRVSTVRKGPRPPLGSPEGPCVVCSPEF